MMPTSARVHTGRRALVKEWEKAVLGSLHNSRNHYEIANTHGVYFLVI
jgi:hypothetical protein